MRILWKNLVWFSKVGLYMRTDEKNGRFGSFPVSADKGSELDVEGPHATAKKWAGEGYRYVEVENRGFSDVVLRDLDIRGNGGRAYRVIVTIDGLAHEVDLREDVLMEVLMTRGVEVGGKLKGTYCFVRRGGEIRLELEGSESHVEALKGYDRVTGGRKLTKRDLVAGHVYRGLSGWRALYFGEVYVGSKMTEAGNPKKSMMFKSELYETVYDYEDVSLLVRLGYSFKNSISYTEDVTAIGDSRVYGVEELLDGMIREWDELFTSGIAYYEDRMRVIDDQLGRLRDGVVSEDDVRREEFETVPEGVLYARNKNRVVLNEDSGTVARDVEEFGRRSERYEAYVLVKSNCAYKERELQDVLDSSIRRTW